MNPQNDPFVINPTPQEPAQPPVVPGGSAEPIVPAPESMFQPITPPVPEPVQPIATYDPGYVQPGMPTQPQPITNLSAKSTKKSKKPLIFGGVLLFVLIVVTVGAIVLSGGGKKADDNTAQQTAAPQGPQPAQAIDIEQASNSISQDVSSHDNAKDFPNDELDDKSLGL